MKIGLVEVEALFDSGAGKSLISSNFYRKLGEEIGKFSPEVAVELLDINNRRLKTRGTLKVCFQVVGESNPENLEQSFIVVDDIAESCVLGLDALYQHRFMFDGSERSIYRIREADHLPYQPLVVSQEKLKIPANSAQIVESEGEYGNLPPNVVCMFRSAPELPKGIRVDPLVTGNERKGLFKIVLVNETNCRITLPKFQVIGKISFEEKKTPQAIAACTTTRPVDTATFDSVLSHVPPDGRDLVKDLLTENNLIFASKTEELGCTGVVKHTINTEGRGPIRLRPYRNSPRQREIAEGIIQELITNKIIRPSLSPWAAPIVLVKKKSGETRLCVDYRGLNGITKKDSFPLPRIDDVLDLLVGQKFFSTLDLASGYWQIELDEESKEKTAFVVENNVYEWNRLAFGLTNAPGTFQRAMNFILKSVIGKICLVYLDDIIVFSKSIEEHVENLRVVFKLLEDANLKLKLAKCSFLKTSVDFLGHVISADGIAPNPSKVEAIAKYPRPRTVRELQSFLGLASYYRRFIKDFASIAHALIIQAKGQPQTLINWGQDEISSFETLKKYLVSDHVLAFPDFSKQFVIFTDASDYGLGAVLSQIDVNGKDRPIAYASRHLNKTEQKYSTIEKEAAALIFGIKRFKYYLQDEPFTIVSDHRPLQWLQTFKDETGRLGRWAIMLGNLKYTVQYRPGRVNENADCLSRIPIASVQIQPETVDDIIREQHTDPLCQDIRSYMEDRILWDENHRIMPIWAKEIDLFFIENNILCRLQAPISEKRRPFPQKQVVVPLTLRKALVGEYHDSPLSGHLAYRRTCQKLRDKYYWPSMLDDVKTYCEKCEVCDKQRKSKNRATLLSLQPAAGPFERLGLDFLGPLSPRSAEGNSYILVITDYFTKWVEVVALPDQTALSTCKALVERIINYHGPPRVIVTDRGTNFTSKLFKYLCEALRIKHCTTTSYHPQSNGLTERFNRTMMEMLRKCTKDGYEDWEEMLGHVAFAYRHSVNASTHETPYFLNHGRDAVMPIDTFLTPYSNEPITPQDYKSLTMKRLFDAFQLVRQNLEKAMRQQKKQYDKRAKDFEYQVGDKVLLDVRAIKPGTSKKLYPRFRGPYRITKVHNNRTVEIQATTGSASKLYHTNRIKPFLEPMVWTDDSVPHFEDLRINNGNLENTLAIPEDVGTEVDDNLEGVNVDETDAQRPIPITEETGLPDITEPFYGFPVAFPRRERGEPTQITGPRPDRPPGLRPWSKIRQREF